MVDYEVRVNIRTRNAVRLAARLPPLDEDAEVHRELRQRAIRAYREDLGTYADLLAQITHEVLFEYERKHGARPTTGFGWWGIYHKAQQRFERKVAEQHGIVRPWF